MHSDFSLKNVLTFSPMTGGCSEGLDAFRFFLEHVSIKIYTKRVIIFNSGVKFGQTWITLNHVMLR